MRLQIMSDLHLEHHPDGGDKFLSALKPSAPTLVLAGDCYNLTAPPINALERICAQYERVFYVPGNHEYYGTTPRAAEMALAQQGWYAIRTDTQAKMLENSVQCSRWR